MVPQKITGTLNSLLGEQNRRCRWINMGGNVWRWVCFTGGEGGGVAGLAGCSNCSNHGKCTMLGEEVLVSDIRSHIASWQTSVNWFANMVKQFPNQQSYKDGLRDAKIQLAYWKAKLNQSPEELMNIGVNQGFTADFQNWVNSVSSPVIDSINPNSLTSLNMASVPKWAWFLLLGGGAALVYSKSKKKRA